MTEWSSIEERWQARWQQERLFESNPDARPKKTITVAYPYPNSPQHLGHGRTYTLADIHARYWRMRRYNVLFPMGFHYTGTPILGMARRVADGDADILDGLLNIYGVPPDIVRKFDEPLNIADYFRDEIEQGMKEMGYSIDWRRSFTTIHPAYQKFVEWQIQALRNRGLIRRGSHPVGWCIIDGNPVSQHDTLGDVEPEFTEYTIIKFKWDDYILPAATLRPETIFGVTNMWVNPDISYQIWQVGSEKWIMTEECAQKMTHQGYDMKQDGTIPPSHILKGMVTSPVGDDIPVLPASFVRADTGTGIVMSVPAHAPFDYAALRQADSDIPPKSIISTPGYADCPAEQLCDDLSDHTSLEEATTQLYSKEFYSGVMRDNCGIYAGRKVSECKDEIREWLMQECGASTIIEMAGEVRCRCGAKCIVKILKDQWFLDYGDHTWKESARRCFDDMEVLPPDIRGEFYNVIEWLRERACARQRGMGTRLPWDPDWIVESLTDSTIYTSFYIMMKYVNDGTIQPEMMDSEFFDYVLLGKGTPPSESADVVRREFLYYYPVDTRHSGRDLVPNHLTFYVMNHTALFGQEHWPRQIVVNGSVLMDGKKMSKSMGNIIPLRGAIKKYGADPIRLGIIISAELLQDADVNLESVSGMGARLEKMIQECRCAAPGDTNTQWEDRWIISKLHHITRMVTANMEEVRMRQALHDIMYVLEQDIQWYVRRLAAQNRSISTGMLHHICGIRARLLAPFAPHAAEEMWHILGNDTLVSSAGWPDSDGIDISIIHDEEYMVSILHDISNIVKVSGVSPHHIRVYVAKSHHIYDTVLRCVMDGATDMRSVMHTITNNTSIRHLRTHPKEIAACLKDILSESIPTRQARLDTPTDEETLLGEHLESVVRTEYDCTLAVFSDAPDSEDPLKKARLARAYHPAIYIE